MIVSHIQTIPLASIQSDDSTYRITTEAQLDPLCASIQRVGLISPPTVIHRSESTFTIVSGFRRIKACRKIGQSLVEANVLFSDTPVTSLTRIAITDNSFQRPLNLIETSRCLRLLSACVHDDRELLNEAASLNLPSNLKAIQKIQSIGSLPEIIQNCIIAGTISLAMATELSALAPDEAIAFAALFDEFKLSLSKQRELKTFVEEIAIREDSTLLEVLQSDGIRVILDQKESDRNRTSEQIRRYFKQRRYPQISEAEKRFNAYVNELKLKDTLKFIPPPHFEGSGYSFQLNFRNMEELEAGTKDLNLMIDNPVLKKILEKSE